MLASCCCADECRPQKKEMCIQLYSARDLIGNAEKYAQNHEAVLKALAEMGYTSVETANYSDGKFYGVPPEQFKADVEAAGMKVLSAHSNYKLSKEEIAAADLSKALAWWDVAIPAHKAAGMEYIVIPSVIRLIRCFVVWQFYIARVVVIWDGSVRLVFCRLRHDAGCYLAAIFLRHLVRVFAIWFSQSLQSLFPLRLHLLQSVFSLEHRWDDLLSPAVDCFFVGHSSLIL